MSKRLPMFVLSLLTALMLGQVAPPATPDDAAAAPTDAAPSNTDAPPAVAAAEATLDPHPLSASQFARLETADDKSGTIDEAALYALLENVRNWSDSEAGSVVPDYDNIRQRPDAWRGRRVLIEGRVKRVIQDLGFSKSGWERVQGVVLLVNPNLAIDDPNAKAHDFVIVYLTDPPVWNWWRKDQGLPLEHGRHVRMTARFFKVTQQETQRAAQNSATEKLNYLAFVGKQFTTMAKPASAQSTSASPFRNIILPMLLVVAIVAYFLYRVNIVRRNYANRPSLRERIEELRGRRDRDDRDEDDAGIPLPRDPVNALDVLSSAHDESEAETLGERADRLDDDDLPDDHPSRRFTKPDGPNGDGHPAYLSDQDNGDTDDHEDDDQSKPNDPAKD